MNRNIAEDRFRLDDGKIGSAMLRASSQSGVAGWPNRLYNCAAPLDLTSPRTSFAVLQSGADLSLVEARVAFILSVAGCDRPSRLAVHTFTEGRYAASDLADVLIELGHTVFVRLEVAGPRSEMCGAETLPDVDARFWLLPDSLDSSDFQLNRNTTIALNRRWDPLAPYVGVDVLHLDAIPYFAVKGCNGIYETVPGHFFLECDSTGQLLVTVLQSDLMPVVRLATGRQAKILRPNAFELSQS